MIQPFSGPLVSFNECRRINGRLPPHVGWISQLPRQIVSSAVRLASEHCLIYVRRPADGMVSLLRLAERAIQMSTHRRIFPPSILAILIVSNIPTSIPAFADLQSVRRGKAFAQANCAQCHSIDRVTRSPRTSAPPFRILHRRYPVETLEDALGEGLSTGHPRMPEFRLDPGQVGDFISFLKSLE
jgi:cytochrome c